MDGQGDHGGSVAIIGMACRFPGASDPAGFHRLTVTAQPRFGPVFGWPGGELHAALVDDWAPAPASLEEHGPGAEDTGPLRKLAAEADATLQQMQDEVEQIESDVEKIEQIEKEMRRDSLM